MAGQRSTTTGPAPEDGPAAESLAERVARLELENRAMTLELENRVLRKRVEHGNRTNDQQAKEF